MRELSGKKALVDWARPFQPRVALVLGSGLGDLVQGFSHLCSFPFLEVPGLTDTSVAGHQGRLILGEWGGQRVLVFSGRLHFYEGLPWRKVLEPIHLAHTLGVKILVLTNAAGGIRPDLIPGSVMAIRKHLDWTRGMGREEWSAESLPLDTLCSTPYSDRLLLILHQTARETGVALTEGTYAQVTGPCYETPAEVRALAQCGADAVGMSTVKEVQTAHDLGLECAALSCITNRAAGLTRNPLNHQEVLEIGQQKKEKMGNLLEKFLRLLPTR